MLLKLGREGLCKSGGPPLRGPSFKVHGDRTHNRNSGFAILPCAVSHIPTRATSQ